MNIPLDEVVYFDVITSHPTTGAVTDADSTPTFAVYEEATDTDIGVGGNLTKRTSLTGNYRGSFTASAANGFEAGKWYSVIASATVNSVAGKAVVKNFRLVTAEVSAGVPDVNVTKVGGTTQTAGDLISNIKFQGAGLLQSTIASVTSSTEFVLNDNFSGTTVSCLAGALVKITSGIGSLIPSIRRIVSFQNNTKTLIIDSAPTVALDVSQEVRIYFAPQQLTEIKAKTDSLTFTVANEVNANARYVGGSAIQQTGGYVKSIESGRPKAWWVSAATGNDSNSGLLPTAAFITLTQALASYSSGDTIYMIDGAFTGAYTISKHNVRIVNLGTCTIAHTGTPVTVTGNYVTFENPSFSTSGSIDVYGLICTNTSGTKLINPTITGKNDGVLADSTTDFYSEGGVLTGAWDGINLASARNAYLKGTKLRTNGNYAGVAVSYACAYISSGSAVFDNVFFSASKTANNSIPVTGIKIDFGGAYRCINPSFEIAASNASQTGAVSGIWQFDAGVAASFSLVGGYIRLTNANGAITNYDIDLSLESTSIARLYGTVCNTSRFAGNVKLIDGDIADILDDTADIIGQVRTRMPRKTWHIAASGGNDSNDGSREAPLATREQAFTSWRNGDVIRFVAGAYAWTTTWDTSTKPIHVEFDDAAVITFTHAGGGPLTYATPAIKPGSGQYWIHPQITCANKGSCFHNSDGVQHLTIERGVLNAYSDVFFLSGFNTNVVLRNNYCTTSFDGFFLSGYNFDVSDNVIFGSSTASELTDGNAQPYSGMQLLGVTGTVRGNTVEMGRAANDARHQTAFYIGTASGGEGPVLLDNICSVINTLGTGKSYWICQDESGVSTDKIDLIVKGGNVFLDAPTGSNEIYLKLKTGGPSTAVVANVAGITDRTKISAAAGSVQFIDDQVDWNNVKNPTTTLNLSGTTVKDATDVETKLGTPAGASLAADIATRLATSGYTAPPSVGAVAAAVCDEALAGHQTAGTAGKALSDASAAGNPWSTLLAGNNDPDTFGELVQTNLDVPVSGAGGGGPADQRWVSKEFTVCIPKRRSGSAVAIQPIRIKATESVVVAIDFTAILGEGDRLATVVSVVTPNSEAITLTALGVDRELAKFTVSDGVAGTTYTIVVTVTTDFGDTLEGEFTILYST